MKAKVVQLCPSPCSPVGSSVHGILQARIPEWVAIPSSRESSRPRYQATLAHMVKYLPAMQEIQVQAYHSEVS